MKIKAPEGYSATMKRVVSFEIGRVHFEVGLVRIRWAPTMPQSSKRYGKRSRPTLHNSLSN
jgi:hypothetical protein